MTRVGSLCLVAIGIHLLTSRLAAENDILDVLVERGVNVAPNQFLKLPAPTLADGLKAASQRQRIESVAGGKYSWEEFTRPAIVAPFVLKISGDKERLGKGVDLWFVAYGNLEALKSDNFLAGNLKHFDSEGGANGPSIKLISDSELLKRGIKAPMSAADPRYVAADFTILDRVRLRTTMRALRTETDNSVLVASVLDERFVDDKEFPIAWQRLTRDDSGRRQIGAPQSYSGIGFYVKATRLVEPVGAMFIEYHAAFAEPSGWFDGANLLRSKLPVITQDAVRKARRTLQE